MVVIKKFHCLGPVSGSNKDFHENSFLKNSFTSTSEYSYDADTKITLFGKEYSYNSALINHGDDLFDQCRKYFLLLHSQLTERGLRTVTDDVNFRLREEIVCFLNYLLSFTEIPALYIDDRDDFLRRLETHLRRLRLLFHKLSLGRLPNHTLAYYSSTLGNEYSSPALHLVHCHLDFRWLFINIVKALGNPMEQDGCSQFTQSSKFSSFCVEEEILLLMNELVWLAIVRYEKADKSELAQFPAFSCVCVKELWLLIMRFQFSSQDFWTYFHQTLQVVLENKEPPTDAVRSCFKVEPPDYLPCSNRNEFALWFLANVARLLEYDSQGDYVGANSDAGEKFEIVDEVLRGLLSEGDGPSEEGMRNLIPLVSKIQAACGHVRSGPIMFLWEYFFKKINSSFYIPGSKLNSNIVMSKTGSALLEEIQARLNGSLRDKRENSFLMFLRLLGEHLLATQRSGASSSRLCSRIFLKFSSSRPEKLKEFLEQGVFHLTSLYLTLALGSGTSSVINRLVELLAAIPRIEGMKEAKHKMIWKSYAASLFAMQEMHADLSEIADLIVKHVDWCIGHPQLSLLEHFLDALTILFKKDVAGVKGLHNLLGSWIPTYLTMSKKTDHFLSMFIPLLQKLKDNSGALEIRSLRTKVEQYVIPSLAEQENGAAAELAGLCALNSFKSRAELFRYWSNREDCTLSGKFLATIIKEGDPDVVTMFPQLQNFVQQIWARFCFTCGANEDSKNLSRSLGSMPQMSSITVDWTGSQPFKSFVEYFGTEYTMCQTLYDKSSLRTSFLSFFPKFDKWLESQCKSLEQLDGEVADQFYEHASELFAHCPYLMYTKSDPHCLLKVIMDFLVLPRTMYKPDYKPPPLVFTAIVRHFGKFVEGLLALDPEMDPYIGRLLRDCVTQYIPRLRNIPTESHPLVPILCRSSRSSSVLKILASFLSVNAGSVQPLATLVLQLLRVVVSSEKTAADAVFDNTSEAVVELMILLDNLHPVKNLALDYISTALDLPRNRMRMSFVLSEACKRHLAFNAAAWFETVLRIAPLCRAEISSLLPIATEAIVELEKRRGVQNDAILRRLLQNLELAVG